MLQGAFIKLPIFDIDGMLFEFCMNFLNIEQNKNFRLKKIFHVFFTFHAISNIKKKLVYTKIIRGGGGGGVNYF